MTNAVPRAPPQRDGGVFVRLDEDTIAARCHGGACQNRGEHSVSRRLITTSSGPLHGMGRIKHHMEARFPDPI